MNVALCFSTAQSILDWVTSDPSVPAADLIKNLELLRADVDLKLHALKKKSDKPTKMGLKGPSKNV